MGITLVLWAFGVLAILNLRQNGLTALLVFGSALVAILLVVSLVALQFLLTTVVAPGEKTYSLGFGTENQSITPHGWEAFDNFTLSATSGLTTGMFGLKITTPSALFSPPPGGAPRACAIGPSTNVSPCTAAWGSWYVLLTNADGDVLATYPSGSATSSSWNGGAVAVSQGETLIIISGSPVADSGMRLQTFATGCDQISGQAAL